VQHLFLFASAMCKTCSSIKHAAERANFNSILPCGRLPVAQLRARLPLAARALLTVQRGLPEHAIAQAAELRGTLCGLLRRCLLEGRAVPAGHADAGAADAAPGDTGSVNGAAQRVRPTAHAYLLSKVSCMLRLMVPHAQP
jgi:hypothetical protein